MSIDIDRVRAETPATEHLAHFNNAGASLPPQPVLDAVIDYLQREAAIGGYATVDERIAQLERPYDAAATLLGCSADEIAFTGGASEAWWRAFSSVELAPGDTIVTSRSEFVANAIGMIQARDRGVELAIIDNDDAGQIDLDAFESRLDDTVKLVCLTHVPMTSGLVNPAAAVGALVRDTDALFLLDACQSVGQLEVDVEAIGCDFLSFTGRKWLRGPRGTGMLYVRSTTMADLPDPVFIDGRAADWTGPTEYRLQPSAKRYELGEIPYAAKAGLGVALDYALDLGIDHIAERIATLATRLRLALAEIDGVDVYDKGVDKCGIVTFTVDGHPAPSVVGALRPQHINLAAPGARNAWLDIGAEGLDSIVRAGVHYFNTDDEIDRLTSAIAAL